MGSARQKAIKAYEAIFGKLDLDSFDNRLKFQKTTYLLKIFGIVDLEELTFTWYKRGPFCFELGGIYTSEMARNTRLSNEENVNVENNKKKIIELISDTSKAELFSSIIYLHKDEKLSREDIEKRISITKPWYKKEEVDSALDKAMKLLSNN